MEEYSNDCCSNRPDDDIFDSNPSTTDDETTSEEWVSNKDGKPIGANPIDILNSTVEKPTR
ncbi:unnamed protein product [Cunninghamella blakesleeana]